jgi:hypothetical protein
LTLKFKKIIIKKLKGNANKFKKYKLITKVLFYTLINKINLYQIKTDIYHYYLYGTVLIIYEKFIYYRMLDL